MALLGLAGNFLALPISFGVMFIFGSIFSIIAVSRLGLWFGAAVAVIGSGYTYFLWHHPYAIIIFTVEILWIGIALRKGRSNLLLIDSLYWLLLGTPLVSLFYSGFLGHDFQHTFIIVLKQSLNGMLNTLVAWIGLTLLPLISWYKSPRFRRPIPYDQVIFQIAATFLMIPTLGVLLMLSQREMEATKKQTVDHLAQESLFTVQAITNWIATYKNATRIIAELGTRSPLAPSDQLQDDLKRIHELFPLFYTLFLADGTATTIACEPAINAKGQSTIGINLSDREWFHELKSTLQPFVSDVFTGSATIFAPIIVIGTPIVKDGNLSHFGLGTVNLEQMERLLEQTSHKQMISTLIDRHGKVVVSTDKARQPLQTAAQPSAAGQTIPIGNEINVWIPGKKKNFSIMESWKGAYYFSRRPIPDTPWTLLVEYPIAPMQNYFYSSTIRGLSIVTGFFVVMITLAALISRYLTAPILALARISKNLPARIASHERITWPHSNFIELSKLINNFQQAATTIDANMATINAHTVQLEQTVAERTAELAREQQRLTWIIDGTNAGTWEWDVQSGETVFNERWAEILGYRLEELQPMSIRTWRDLIHPEDLKNSNILLEQHFAGTLDAYDYECRMRHKDGHWVWVHDRGKLISRTADNKPLMMAGTHSDITTRKVAEEALKESKALLLDAEMFSKATIDSLAANICVINNQGAIISVNKSWKIFAQENGYNPHNTWEGVNYLDVCERTSGEESIYATPMASAIRSILQGRTSRFSMEYPCNSPDKIRWFEANVGNLEMKNEICAVIMHRDITGIKDTELRLHEKTQQLESLTNDLKQQVDDEVTRRLQSEQILLQQSKLAAMGEMLGAIAHQWRQPLNALGLIIQNLHDAAAFGEINEALIESSVQKSMGQIEHMSKTIDDFRNFFKPDKQKSTFDPMQVAGEVLLLISAQLSAHRISYRLTCHTHNRIFEDMTTIPSCQAMLITGYHNEFRHVILNLLSNAQDAILTARSNGKQPGQREGRINLDFEHADTTVVIKISDNGGGIDDAILARLFEPYFTTKGPDKGTGLGLYMSKLIIEHMNGRLSVRNGASGAVFTIELPGQAETAATKSNGAD